MATPFRRALAVGAAVAASGMLAFGFYRTRKQRAQVRRITVAFAGSERPALQRALDDLAGRADMSAPDGRADAARAVCALLRESVNGAYTALATREDFAPDDAPPRFDALASDLRRRYDVETRRNRETAPAPALPRDAREPGYLVVTVLVGLDEARPFDDRVYDRAALRAALDALVPTRCGLAALEVIWSPSVDEDRMAADALAAHYPELVPLRDGSAR
jgi:uncharacterized membrane protein